MLFSVIDSLYPNFTLPILVLLRRLRDSKYREQSDRKTFNVSPSYIFPTISIKYFYHDVAVPELFQTLRISWTVWQENSQSIIFLFRYILQYPCRIFLSWCCCLWGVWDTQNGVSGLTRQHHHGLLIITDRPRAWGVPSIFIAEQ